MTRAQRLPPSTFNSQLPVVVGAFFKRVLTAHGGANWGRGPDAGTSGRHPRPHERRGDRIANGPKVSDVCPELQQQKAVGCERGGRIVTPVHWHLTKRGSQCIRAGIAFTSPLDTCYVSAGPLAVKNRRRPGVAPARWHPLLRIQPASTAVPGPVSRPSGDSESVRACERPSRHGHRHAPLWPRVLRRLQ